MLVTDERSIYIRRRPTSNRRLGVLSVVAYAVSWGLLYWWAENGFDLLWGRSEADPHVPPMLGLFLVLTAVPAGMAVSGSLLCAYILSGRRLFCRLFDTARSVCPAYWELVFVVASATGGLTLASFVVWLLPWSQLAVPIAVAVVLGSIMWAVIRILGARIGIGAWLGCSAVGLVAYGVCASRSVFWALLVTLGAVVVGVLVSTLVAAAASRLAARSDWPRRACRPIGRFYRVVCPRLDDRP